MLSLLNHLTKTILYFLPQHIKRSAHQFIVHVLLVGVPVVVVDALGRQL